jgi:hypothetical protein
MKHQNALVSVTHALPSLSVPGDALNVLELGVLDIDGDRGGIGQPQRQLRFCDHVGEHDLARQEPVGTAVVVRVCCLTLQVGSG